MPSFLKPWKSPAIVSERYSFNNLFLSLLYILYSFSRLSGLQVVCVTHCCSFALVYSLEFVLRSSFTLIFLGIQGKYMCYNYWQLKYCVTFQQLLTEKNSTQNLNLIYVAKKQNTHTHSSICSPCHPVASVNPSSPDQTFWWSSAAHWIAAPQKTWRGRFDCGEASVWKIWTTPKTWSVQFDFLHWPISTTLIGIWSNHSHMH